MTKALFLPRDNLPFRQWKEPVKTAIIATLLIATAALAILALWLWTPDRPRAALEREYLRAPTDMMDFGGFRLHVRDSGKPAAPAIILLHGFGASLHAFEAWADVLDENYRVISFDLPGSGLSEPDPSGVYTDARSMEIVLKLMDRLAIKSAVLVGNSIGGRLAWRFAADHPDRVTRLVLISPDGYASPGFEYGRPPEVPALMTAMRYVLPRFMLRPNIAAAYGNPDNLTVETFERYHALLLAPGNRAAMLERMRQTVLVDPEPFLRKIRVPVLLLWGEKDAMIPLANAADYMRILPQAELVTFPALGHVPHEEAPLASLAPVLAFLAE
jgi:pimeloyl-ACP methyl ester carboxylesterase